MAIAFILCGARFGELFASATSRFIDEGNHMKQRNALFLLIGLGAGLFAAPPRVFRDVAAANTALMDAIKDGDTARVTVALNRGADVNIKEADGSPAIVEAALFGNTLMIELLLERGADPNAATPAGLTALHVAAGDLGKARMLIAHGANVNARTKAGRTPLLIASRQDGAYPIVKLLLEKGADVKATDAVPAFGMGPGANALILAAKTSDVRTARLLVQYGLDVKTKTPSGDTALIEAAWNGNIEVVRYLISQGADAKATIADPPFKGFTALSFAAALDHAEIGDLLIAAGADVNARDGSGYTPLHWAAMSERGDARLVRSMIAAGADVNLKGAFDETPLTWAAKRGETPIVDALKRAGAQGQVAATAPPMTMPVSTRSADLKTAVAKAMDPLMKSSPVFFKTSGCFSCHNQTLPVQAASMARSRGIEVDQEAEQKAYKSILAFVKPSQEVLLEMTDAMPDVNVSAGYALDAMAAESHAADGITTALVHNIAGKQMSDGRWQAFGPRPPMENGSMQSTAFAIRAVQLYGMPGRKVEFEKRLARARHWLRDTEARTTEEQVMKLYGLYWAKAPTAEATAAANLLLASQRADGGWAQLPALESDAYATGKAMVALRETGRVETTDAVYRRGVAFLLATQGQDGTWLVKTRAFPFQPLKPSGFPHDRDQWISAAGTSWAAMALAEAIEPAHRVAMSK
jgi:ankyrin repeat protein